MDEQLLAAEESPDVYHTVPAKACKQLADSVEMLEAVHAKSILKEMIATSYNMELIAYPNKAAYEESALIREKTVEQGSSSALQQLRFTPEVLDFGYR